MKDKDRTDRTDRVGVSLGISTGFVTKGGARWRPVVGLLLVFAMQPSCSKELSPAVPTLPSANEVNAFITVVDGDGSALAGVIPLVTSRPNAFDEPLAMGAPTGVDGKGSVRFASATKVYLRAWDPLLERFPNNYYDVLPESGNIAEGLEIVMLNAATLKASLLAPTGEPAALDNVAVMLVHPSRGPWWPAKGRTDAAGGLHLSKLPPGKFSLRIETASGYRLDVGEVAMLPGDTVDLGALALQ